VPSEEGKIQGMRDVTAELKASRSVIHYISY